MKKAFIMPVVFFYSLIPEPVRNIFEYDLNWNHADYEIVAHGCMHETGKVFKFLQCGDESKIFVPQ